VEVTLWTGPVSNEQVPACFVPGSVFVPAFTCRNPYLAPVPTCNAMIETYRDGERYLPRMLLSRKIQPSDVTRVFLGSFSAGHNAVKDRILMNAPDRALVGAVMLADSTYTEWRGGDARNGPIPRPGYVAYMLDCLTSPKAFMATAGASTPLRADGSKLPSSAQSMWALADEVERVTGKQFESVSLPAAVSPTPVLAKRILGANGGIIVLADFGALVEHPDHALKLAPQMWRHLLLPWLGLDPCAGTKPNADPGSCPVYVPQPFPPGIVPSAGEPGFMGAAPAAPAGAASVAELPPWAPKLVAAGLGVAVGVGAWQALAGRRRS